MPGRRFTGIVSLFLVAGLGGGQAPAAQTADTSIDNNRPFRNDAGHGRHSAHRASVYLDGESFQPQGTNGRAAPPCHLSAGGVEHHCRALFNACSTSQAAPIQFSISLDANNPFAGPFHDRSAGSLLQHDVEPRRVPLRRCTSGRTREWDLFAVDDPHGFANLGRLVHWRRAMPTINFAAGQRDRELGRRQHVCSDQHAGLESRLRGMSWERNKVRNLPPRSSPTSSISRPRCSPLS